MKEVKLKFIKQLFSKINKLFKKSHVDTNTLYKLDDIFTPGTVAKHTFIERPMLTDKINEAIETTGKQLIIFGNSQSGKTTIIHNVLNKKGIKYIIYNCTPDSTFEDLIRHTFDELNYYYTIEISKKEVDSIVSEISANYKFISAKTKANSSSEVSERKVRIIPPELTIQSLAKFIGAAEKFLIIEDFHKVDFNERKKIAHTLKLMSDIATSFPKTKVIAIGAVDTANQLIELDRDITNRVAQIFIPLMNEEELKSIIKKGEDLLNIQISSNIKNDIIKMSQMLASVCHQLSRSVCNYANIYETQVDRIIVDDDTFIKKAIETWDSENSSSYRIDLENAILNIDSKVVNISNILMPFCYLNKDELSFDEIYKEYNTTEIREKKRKKAIRIATLKNEIEKLTEEQSGSILRKTSNGKYCLTSPYFKVLLLMDNNKNVECKKDDNLKSIFFGDKINFDYTLKFNNSFKFIEAKNEFIQSGINDLINNAYFNMFQIKYFNINKEKMDEIIKQISTDIKIETPSKLKVYDENAESVAWDFYLKKDFNKSLDLYLNQTKLEPDNPSLWKGVSMCYSRLEQLESALESGLKALDLAKEKFNKYDEKLSYYYNQIGIVYFLLKQYNLSIEYLNMSLTIFNNPKIVDLVSSIRKGT